MSAEDAVDEQPAPMTGVDDVAWRPSYDRQSVDRYLADVETEKARLLEEIRLAEERVTAAQERGRASTTERDALLGALLLAARAEMERVDTEHRAGVAAIYAAAEEEAAGIRDRAQANATAVREVVASLAAITESTDAEVDEPASRDQRHGG
jgi:cell division septum initiation protein DivIVA